MTQAGGSANINGVLYQILGSIDWAARIRLSATVEDNEFSKALLILEPAGGGGDIVIKWDTGRIVEQWKAKSDQGTWSLAEVIEKVIPDLYLSVDSDHLDDNSEYRFITEGRRGKWENAEEFFKTLKFFFHCVAPFMLRLVSSKRLCYCFMFADFHPFFSD